VFEYCVDVSRLLFSLSLFFFFFFPVSSLFLFLQKIPRGLRFCFFRGHATPELRWHVPALYVFILDDDSGYDDDCDEDMRSQAICWT